MIVSMHKQYCFLLWYLGNCNGGGVGFSTTNANKLETKLLKLPMTNYTKELNFCFAAVYGC